MSVAAISGALVVSYLPLILLTLAVVVGIPLAYRHWREAHEEEDPIRGTDLFSEFERSDAASKMSEAEFRRVRELLIGAKAGSKAEPRAKRPTTEPEEEIHRGERGEDEKSDTAGGEMENRGPSEPD